ncbi:hypothetical protein [Pseudomonas cremoricolorata]|uniref:Uncharacterized protein n=1 Tax=Pseudomonas cremoricolorata TaxID=157783 RepID=A0A089WQG2_9PSED|nr:hypothetical protein [Pseudomonas cremoricolorata]AIR90811.1 hypothetical protein LK03_16720 [Pseudomonas cremoricolorata]
MQQRFVIVPALPKEKDVIQRKTTVWSGVSTARFDLYDNLEKQRLTLSLQSRPDAEAECSRRNCAG